VFFGGLGGSVEIILWMILIIAFFAWTFGSTSHGRGGVSAKDIILTFAREWAP
jgi:hypothetical protein